MSDHFWTFCINGLTNIWNKKQKRTAEFSSWRYSRGLKMVKSNFWASWKIWREFFRRCVSIYWAKWLNAVSLIFFATFLTHYSLYEARTARFVHNVYMYIFKNMCLQHWLPLTTSTILSLSIPVYYIQTNWF